MFLTKATLLGFLWVLFWVFFWPHHRACWILVLRLGVEPASPAVEVQSLNHWTTREVPKQLCL